MLVRGYFLGIWGYSLGVRGYPLPLGAIPNTRSYLFGVRSDHVAEFTFFGAIWRLTWGYPLGVRGYSPGIRSYPLAIGTLS